MIHAQQCSILTNFAVEPNLIIPAMTAQIFDSPAIAGHSNHQNTAAASIQPEINHGLVGSAAMILDLFARRHTGVKYRPAENILSKDNFLENQLNASEELFENAMRFGKEIGKYLEYG